MDDLLAVRSFSKPPKSRRFVDYSTTGLLNGQSILMFHVRDKDKCDLSLVFSFCLSPTTTVTPEHHFVQLLSLPLHTS